ncbi:hypothetical protein JCM8097_008649 [Rhodosporidiobolus ruineniae]
MAGLPPAVAAPAAAAAPAPPAPPAATSARVPFAQLQNALVQVANPPTPTEIAATGLLIKSYEQLLTSEQMVAPHINFATEHGDLANMKSYHDNLRQGANGKSPADPPLTQAFFIQYMATFRAELTINGVIVHGGQYLPIVNDAGQTEPVAQGYMYGAGGMTPERITRMPDAECRAWLVLFGHPAVVPPHENLATRRQRVKRLFTDPSY